MIISPGAAYRQAARVRLRAKKKMLAERLSPRVRRTIKAIPTSKAMVMIAVRKMMGKVDMVNLDRIWKCARGF